MKTMRYDKIIDDTSVARYGRLDTARVLFRATGLPHDSDRTLSGRRLEGEETGSRE